MSESKRQKTAFSLLELLAVVTILGVIAALVVPRMTGNAHKAQENSCYHNVAQINAAAERWYIDKGVWPNANPSLDMGADPNYFPEGLPTCPVSGVTYSLHATTHRIIGHNGGGKGIGHP